MKPATFIILALFSVLLALTAANPVEQPEDTDKIGEVYIDTGSSEPISEQDEELNDNDDDDDDDLTDSDDDDDSDTDETDNSEEVKVVARKRREVNEENIILYNEASESVGKARPLGKDTLAIELDKGIVAECERNNNIQPGYENHGWLLDRTYDREGSVNMEAFFSDTSSIIMKWNGEETFVCQNWLKISS